MYKITGHQRIMFHKIVTINHIITIFSTFVLYTCVIMCIKYVKKRTTFAKVTLKSWLPLLKFKSSGATATSATATLPRNSYNKVAYATGLNLPFYPRPVHQVYYRRSYMKHSLPVKITIIFSSIQLKLSLHYDIFVNSASTYTYYKPFILFHQSKVTETSYFLRKKIY